MGVKKAIWGMVYYGIRYQHVSQNVDGCWNLIQTSSCFNHFLVCPGPWDPSTLPTLARALFANAMDATCGQLRLGVVVVVSFWGLLGNVPNLISNRATIWRWCFPISANMRVMLLGLPHDQSQFWPIPEKWRHQRRHGASLLVIPSLAYTLTYPLVNIQKLWKITIFNG